MHLHGLTLQTLLQQIQHRPVRDLSWALLHPPFFTQLPEMPVDYLCPDWLDADLTPWLLALDQQPQALFEHLKTQRATRLGIYFEQLLSFYFSHYPCFELVAKNLQAQDAKRTIGEYDFIVFDYRRQQYYHIEVAVKFYVGLHYLNKAIANNQPHYNWHHWVGPNYKDTLAIKMMHLANHQMQLSETDAGRAALKTIGLEAEQLQVKLLLTGRLYYPLQASPQNITINAPQHSNSQCTRGAYWLTKQALIQQCQPLLGSEDSYIFAPRQLWMAPLTKEDIQAHSLEILSKKDMLTTVASSSKNEVTPLHVVQLPKETQYLEQQHFFILSED